MGGNVGAVQNVSPHFQVVSNNGYRLLGFVKGLNTGAAADTAFPVIGTGSFVPAVIVTTNSSGTVVDVSTATVGVFTQPAGGGSTVHATAALTGQSTAAFAYVRATSVTATVITANTLFARVVTTVANGATDLFLYGYDVQTPTP